MNIQSALAMMQKLDPVRFQKLENFISNSAKCRKL